MWIFKDDLNKTAVSIAKVIHLLKNIKEKIIFPYDIIDHKDDILFITYICRVSILDRVEKNNWPLSMPIIIPTGLITVKKVTLSKALEDTIGKTKALDKKIFTLMRLMTFYLKEICSMN